MNPRKIALTAAGTMLAIAVASAAFVITSRDDTPRVGTQGTFEFVPAHVFPKGIVTICAQVKPLQKNGVAFTSNTGKVFGITKPGFANTAMGPGRKITVVRDNNTRYRFRWCASYEAPRASKRKWAIISLKAANKTLDEAHVRLLPRPTF